MASWTRPAFALLALSALSLSPSVAEARCAPPSLADEVSRSSVVVEARLTGVSDEHMLFEVTARWKGRVGRRIRVHRNFRANIATADDVGTEYLVIAHRDRGALSFSRCGATGKLATRGATLDELRQLGLTRRPAPARPR